jgi:hypothetical protein
LWRSSNKSTEETKEGKKMATTESGRSSSSVKRKFKLKEEEKASDSESEKNRQE